MSKEIAETADDFNDDLKLADELIKTYDQTVFALRNFLPNKSKDEIVQIICQEIETGSMIITFVNYSFCQNTNYLCSNNQGLR